MRVGLDGKIAQDRHVLAYLNGAFLGKFLYTNKGVDYDYCFSIVGVSCNVSSFTTVQRVKMKCFLLQYDKMTSFIQTFQIKTCKQYLRYTPEQAPFEVGRICFWAKVYITKTKPWDFFVVTRDRCVDESLFITLCTISKTVCSPGNKVYHTSSRRKIHPRLYKSHTPSRGMSNQPTTVPFAQRQHSSRTGTAILNVVPQVII